MLFIYCIDYLCFLHSDVLHRKTTHFPCLATSQQLRNPLNSGFTVFSTVTVVSFAPLFCVFHVESSMFRAVEEWINLRLCQQWSWSIHWFNIQPFWFDLCQKLITKMYLFVSSVRSKHIRICVMHPLIWSAWLKCPSPINIYLLRRTLWPYACHCPRIYD